MSDKIDFSINISINRDKQGYFVMIKGSIHHRDIVIIVTALKYMKQNLTELQGKIDNFMIIVGDLNTILASTDRTRF